MSARSCFIVSLFSLVALCSVAIADDPEIYLYRSKGAVKGVDAVAYFSLSENAKAVKGSDEFTHEWKVATWRFSSEENRKAFRVAPKSMRLNMEAIVPLRSLTVLLQPPGRITGRLSMVSFI